jgi:hypothetical protein
MNGLRASATKVLGLQHPQDKILEIFEQFGLIGRVLDAGAGSGEILSKLKGLGAMSIRLT